MASIIDMVIDMKRPTNVYGTICHKNTCLNQSSMHGYNMYYVGTPDTIALWEWSAKRQLSRFFYSAGID